MNLCVFCYSLVLTAQLLKKKKKTGVSTKPLLVLQLQNIKADILLIYVATTNLPSGP